MTEEKLQEHRPPSLTVYKASAGSGKTFRLAIDYIKLLIANPQSYRNILAVTFTNKATEEMKMRILSQLYGIWKRLPDSQSYTQTVCRELQAAEEWVSARAGIALQQLLHHYNYFRIETIDSFFQSVLRNLARELDLPPKMNIGLNDQQIMEMAVDKLIEETKQNDEVMQWMMRFVQENIRDDKSWNIIGQVKDFGRIIFREFYKVESKRINTCISQPGFFDSYVSTLRAIEADAQRSLDAYAERFFTLLNAHGISVNDFVYKQSGACSPFVKLQNGNYGEDIFGKRAMDGMDDADKWLAAKERTNPRLRPFVEDVAIPLLRELYRERPQLYRRLQSARLTLRHLNQLRLLGSIEAKMRQLNDEANRFLLSDTQALLHALIQGNDTPFIFEKTGAFLEHIMIDEFQDTSSTQWKNFQVLLSECMSQSDPYNLIVGDVKQSIYRWRAGDWTLLNNIEQAFGSQAGQIRVEALAYNYRSCRRIVDFNNALFETIARQESEALAAEDNREADQLLKAYSDVRQHLPEGRRDEGYVEVTLLPKDEDADDIMLSQTADTIASLLALGVEQHQIAILVRTNKHIPLIARYLMEHDNRLEVISDEAFRLDASLAVNILVKAMHCISHPEDEVVRADLTKAYQHCILSNQTPLEAMRCNGGKSMLPEAFEREMPSLREMSLPDMAERIYQLFGLDRLSDEGAYVCTFHDCLSQFLEGRMCGIDDFLDEWEKTYCSKTIMSDNQHGLRIISIHKSKGLEFDNVIIPYCNWSLEPVRLGNILWCRPQEEPYNALPLVPVSPNAKSMQGTIYEEDYRTEHLQNMVDNLNLLYVAFTRACHRLYVIGTRGSAGSRSESVELALPELKHLLRGSCLMGDDTENDPIVFSYGTTAITAAAEKQETLSKNVFSQPAEATDVPICCFSNHTEYRQSNRSRQFLKEAEEEFPLDAELTEDAEYAEKAEYPADAADASASATDKTGGKQTGRHHDRESYIALGSLMHHLLSEVRTADDIERAILRLEMEGALEQGGITARRIRQLWQRSMNNPQAASWFDGSWVLHNERSIVLIDPTTGKLLERRPDRVMQRGEEIVVVDFKFGREKDEYQSQVREYMQLIRQMGKKQVRAFIWYVYTGKITEVSSATITEASSINTEQRHE